MRINWRRFAFVFGLLQVLFLVSGCTAAWIGALQGLIPTIEGIVSAAVAFIAALEGKTVSATFNAKVQQWGTQVSDLLTQLSSLVASAAKTATTTIITQIQSVMAQLSTSLGSILQDSDVTDPSTVSKIEEFVQLAIAAVNAVLAVIPVALARIKAGATQEELQVVDGDAKNTINQAHDLAKKTYHVIVTQQTPQIDVNSALGKLPQNIH